MFGAIIETMVGSIAEAYYGVPNYIKESAIYYLDNFLYEIIKEFEIYYLNKLKI